MHIPIFLDPGKSSCKFPIIVATEVDKVLVLLLLVIFSCLLPITPLLQVAAHWIDEVWGM